MTMRAIAGAFLILTATARGDDWPPVVTAANAGIDAKALDTLLQCALEAKSDSVCVLVDGALVHEEYFNKPQKPIELMSCTKSVVSLLIGRLIDDGKIESVATPVAHWFPEFLDAGGGKDDPAVRAQRESVTLRHLLTHTSGIAADATTEKVYASEDVVEFALGSRLATPPGTVFLYNNVACNLLCGIVEKASGKKADDYARAMFFEPLGITDFGWTRDAKGNPHGMAGCQLHAIDLARIGQLVLQRGEWEGERLISEAWLDEAMKPAFPDLGGGASTCGYLWWLDVEPAKAGGKAVVLGVRAEGFLGNHLLIVPEKRLVAVRQRRFPQIQVEMGANKFNFPDFTTLARRLLAGK